MSTHEISATFDIDLAPSESLLEGTGRFDFTKTWSGSMTGTGSGVMLSAGDPTAGSAGYVAVETFTGTVDGRDGSLSFQQFGSMTNGVSDLRYEIVPGSGTGDLTGISGAVALTVVDGVHQVTLTYELG